LIVIIFVASLLYARREARLHHVRHLEGLSPEEASKVLAETD
jgi:hypothetical protein